MSPSGSTKNICLITGSSSGIGWGVAETLSTSSYYPIITYNSHEDEARKLEKAILFRGGECLCLKLNLSSSQSIVNFVKSINKQFKHLDTIVCNAGKDYYHTKPDEATLDEWNDVFYTKVFGHYLLVKLCRPLLEKSKNANVIGISASLYEKPDPNDPVYSSACAAHVNYILSLVYAYAPYRIRANVINPGPIKTNLSYWNELQKNDATIFQSMIASSPTGKLPQPSEIAQTIDFIVTSKNLNGNVIYVNSGTHLR